MRKNILDLSNIECNKFFIQQKQYTNLDLPQYFTFEKVLLKIKKEMINDSLNIKVLKNAKKMENVNHVIFGNKDGKYTWRKFELINPLLYVSLVNLLTEKNNWILIRNRLGLFRKNSSVICLSVPVLSDSDKSQKATQISEWVDQIEKESIRLALEFEYLYQTDISNCYGSIYTHSISWAIHGRRVSKDNRSNYNLCGNMIDEHLQAMSNGQTNGIPEGSTLMDFLAEILLAYSDYELDKKIEGLISKECYKILRYRDDYRIFVRDPKHGELIIRFLSEILSNLGLRLNTFKTSISNEIIINSIKPDKIAYLHKPMTHVLSKNNLYNELFRLYEIGINYSNCGTIKRELTKLYESYENLEANYFFEQEVELISILSNISLSNPSAFPIIAAFISKIIFKLNKSRKKIIIEKLFRKLKLLPNSGLLEMWLQRITEPNLISIKYDNFLCKKVHDNKYKLFNNLWEVTNKYKTIIDKAEIVDKSILASIDKVIKSDEIRLYYYDYSR